MHIETDVDALLVAQRERPVDGEERNVVAQYLLLQLNLEATAVLRGHVLHVDDELNVVPDVMFVFLVVLESDSCLLEVVSGHSTDETELLDVVVLFVLLVPEIGESVDNEGLDDVDDHDIDEQEEDKLEYSESVVIRVVSRCVGLLPRLRTHSFVVDEEDLQSVQVTEFQGGAL